MKTQIKAINIFTLGHNQTFLQFTCLVHNNINYIEAGILSQRYDRVEQCFAKIKTIKPSGALTKLLN